MRRQSSMRIVDRASGVGDEERDGMVRDVNTWHGRRTRLTLISFRFYSTAVGSFVEETGASALRDSGRRDHRRPIGGTDTCLIRQRSGEVIGEIA